MKWAVVIAVVAIGVILIGAVLTHPGYKKLKEKENREKHVDEIKNGLSIYKSNCADSCHQQLLLAALGNSKKYSTRTAHPLYPEKYFTAQGWYKLLFEKDESNKCNGIQQIKQRYKELIWTYLRDEAADDDDFAAEVQDALKTDIEKGEKILKNSKGKKVFDKTCATCHRAELPKAFTKIELQIYLKKFADIHKDKKAKLPEDKNEYDKLIGYLKFSTSPNPKLAKIIRELLRELRKYKSENGDSVKNGKNSKMTEEIPAEIKWVDLNWQFNWSGGLEELKKKFPDKPILLEITNKYR